MENARSNIFSSRKTYVVRLFLALLLCCSLAVLNGCSLQQTQDPDPYTRSNTQVEAQSYEEVYAALKQTFENQNERYSGFAGSEMMIEESTSEAAPLASSDSEALSSGDAKSSSYSETNVQVSGIDEGDIVKTDGEYIYIVSGTTVIIAKAEGETTQEVSRIAFTYETLQKQGDSNTTLYPNEIYIDGDTLAVLYQSSPEGYVFEGDDDESIPLTYPYYSHSISEVAFFDVSDAANPSLIDTFGQDGYFSSSRLQDGILYMISTYYVYDSDISSDEPSTYIPLLYRGSTAQLIATPDICILPDLNSTAYTIVSSFDTQNISRVDQQSVLGSGDTIYMSYDNLYIAGYLYEKIENDSYQDGSFTVTEYTDTSNTRIIKLPLDSGKITVGADTVIEGALLNQFSLDEYDGNLRAVTTINKSSYRLISDEKSEFTDYNFYPSIPTTNSLYILNEDLVPTGSLEGLAEDERVYSVRFDGEVGYFVTFRQTDPLFAVDLSNPSNPEIKSALKIPGFSTYLHAFSEDRLFGLGMAADEDGRVQGMKLSMFNTSDPYNVTEKHKLELDSSYSEALYNHKAIIIDPEQNLIGFPSDEGYTIYGYSDEEGFYLRAKLSIPSADDYYYYYSTMRGLYVDEYFYLASPELIGVYTLDTLDSVTKIELEHDDSIDSGSIMPLMEEN